MNKTIDQQSQQGCQKGCRDTAEIVFTAVQACPVHTGPDCTVASTALSRQRDCAACSCSADRTMTTQQAAQASFLSHFCSCFTSVVPHTTPGWGTSRCCTLITRPCPSRGTPRKLVRSLASDLACVYHKRTSVLQAAQPAQPALQSLSREPGAPGWG